MADDEQFGEHRVTTDPATVEEWAKEHDAVPVRVPGNGSKVEFVREDAVGDRDRMDWSELRERFDQGEFALVNRGRREDEWRYDLVDREVAAERATLDTEEVQKRLLEGETVTTTVTETQVIEAEITETETIEHEVLGRELVDSKIIDRDLVERTFGDPVLDADALAAWLDERRIDEDRFDEVLDEEMGLYETQYEGKIEDVESDMGPVTVDVRDTVSVTREDLERITVESRVIGTDVTGTDAVTEDTIETSIDVEGVQRNIVESGIVEAGRDPEPLIDADCFRTEVREGTMTTELYQRRIVDVEVVQEHELTFAVVGDQLRSTDVGPSQVVETEIVDRSDVEVEAVEPAETVRMTEEREMTEPVDESARTVPASRDQGKDVVDAGGQEIGMVANVEADTMYVDPHPSLTDRIKAALDWGGSEETYPVEPENVRRIDDEVVLAVDAPEPAEDER